MGRLMSDAEIKRRKKAQGAISRTTATLGLGGLAMLGAAKASGTKPGFLTPVAKPVTRAVRRAGMTTEGVKNAAQNTSVVAGGIGGAGGYNFAAYTSAESRKRGPRTPVKEPNTRIKKNYDILDMGVPSEEGIAKNWEPVARRYDPEQKRASRAKGYETGTAVGAAALAGGAGFAGLKAGGLHRQAERAKKMKKATTPLKNAAKAHGRDAGLLAAGAAGAGAAHAGVKQWRKKEFGKSYGQSAFGVTHD